MAVDGRAGSRTQALKALAEPVRWQIVERLAVEDLCVCHLVDDLRLPQPLVSHHLKVLREAGLVAAERYRQWTYHRLDPEAIAAVASELSGLVDRPSRDRVQRRPCC